MLRDQPSGGCVSEHRYISSFIRRRGGWNKYQKQQALLTQQQQQHVSMLGSSATAAAAGGSGMRPPALKPKPNNSSAAAAAAELNPRDPRRGLQASPEPRLNSAALNPGLNRSRVTNPAGGLTSAISKTLGMLTQQLGEWEAAEAEAEALGFRHVQDDEGTGDGGGLEGSGGEHGLGVRDYYFDDEEVADDDELLEAYE